MDLISLLIVGSTKYSVHPRFTRTPHLQCDESRVAHVHLIGLQVVLEGRSTKDVVGLRGADPFLIGGVPGGPCGSREIR